MIDPATGALIGATSGSLTLLNSIIKICQERAKDPGAHPLSLAEVIATLPGEAQKLTGEMIAQIEGFRAELRNAGIDPKLTLDELQAQTWFYQRRRRKLLKAFQARAEAIAAQISILFDDVVSVADCADHLHVVARSFAASREQKQKLREQTADDLPLGDILDNLLAHAERVREELGDLNRQK
jgi:hypothetical protein